jgi:tricarballylate dehydrogenase
MSNGARDFDVIVAGCGNAALCAALAASEAGARVAVLEWAPEKERGGNSAFTGGTMRMAFASINELRRVLDLSDEEETGISFDPYPTDHFYEDVARTSGYRADGDLLLTLVDNSLDTVAWIRSHGIHFILPYGKYGVKDKDKVRFWGGVAAEVSGGGLGLVDGLARAAERMGVEIFYGQRAWQLLIEDGNVAGLVSRRGLESSEWHGKSVVLATGGFQANPQWRAAHLGKGWDMARVRGTRYDMGDGIRMALEAGAAPSGNWSECHAVSWDLNAPSFGDRALGDRFSRHSYPMGIMVNAEGERFLDEGADLRNLTYAKYGKVILEQPGQFGWQIFDAKVADLLIRDFYRVPQGTRVKSDTLEGLVEQLEGVNKDRCLQTIRGYNESVDQSVPFDPARRDGRGTRGITPPKSNWANTLDTPPFEAFAVTCGITFTFGGVKTSDRGEVLDADDQKLPGLYAAGEMVGGLFYGNYPGSTGLAWGAVLGKRAGEAAAEHSLSTH